MDDTGPDVRSVPGRSPVRDHVDLAACERLLAAVRVEPPA